MSHVNLRPYGLAQLEEKPEAGPVWVLNSSKGDRRGDVVLTVARQTGIGSDAIIVPATFIPMDLTMIVSRPQLLRDNQFRQALHNGLLRLVHPDDCAKMFEEDEGARREQARLSNYMLVGGVAHQQQASQHDVEVFGDRPSSDSDIPAVVKTMIQRIELAHKEGELDEQKENEFISVFRGMGELDEAVLKHVYHATAKLAPSLSKVAKAMAGR